MTSTSGEPMLTLPEEEKREPPAHTLPGYRKRQQMDYEARRQVRAREEEEALEKRIVEYGLIRHSSKFVEPKKKPSRKRQSAGSRAKQQAKRRVDYVKKTKDLRSESFKMRDPTHHPTGEVVSPQIKFHSTLTNYEHLSSLVTAFYECSSWPHRDIRLSEDGEVNVSNPTGKKGGGRGVFAVRDIPSGTTLCPYVGVVQKKRCQDEACDYCLMLRPGLYLCARNILYDEGYFAACHVDTPFCRKEVVNEERPMPPNYGRYFNTLAGRPGAEAFNCELQASRDGQNVCFLETRCAVSAGEELLVDYGSEFVIMP